MYIIIVSIKTNINIIIRYYYLLELISFFFFFSNLQFNTVLLLGR